MPKVNAEIALTPYTGIGWPFSAWISLRFGWWVVCCFVSDSFEIFLDSRSVDFVSDSKDRFSIVGSPALLVCHIFQRRV